MKDNRVEKTLNMFIPRYWYIIKFFYHYFQGDQAYKKQLFQYFKILFGIHGFVMGIIE